MSETLPATLELFLAVMAHDAGTTPRTFRSYRRELSAAATALTAPFELLRREELERWIARDAAAPSTVARRRAMLRRLFGWAVATRRCSHNPLAVDMRRPAPRPLTAKERRSLDAALDHAPMPYRLAFVLLRETTLRISEVLVLEGGDVCLVPGYESLRVHARARRSERTVLLGPIATPRTLRLLSHALRSRGRADRDRRLLQGPLGPVSYAALRYRWTQLCLQIGLVDAAGRPRHTLQQLGVRRDG